MAATIRLESIGMLYDRMIVYTETKRASQDETMRLDDMDCPDCGEIHIQDTKNHAKLCKG